MRIVADILKMISKIVYEGVVAINVASFSMDYLAALKGMKLEINEKHNNFIEFIQSCTPLASNSFLIKNFFLLCGIPIKSNSRASKLTLKVKNDDKKE